MSAAEVENSNSKSNKEREDEILTDMTRRWAQRLRRYDSLDIESAKVKGHYNSHGFQQGASWAVILQLAFQSIGVVYGDIGTSPLYVFASTFQEGIKHDDDVVGVLSLIYYTLTLLPLKYVFIVLRANDNSNAGTFALYSLLCRHARVGLLPSQQVQDGKVSNYQLDLPSTCLGCSSKVKSALESSRGAKFILLFITMLATSLVIGDGILTPCISVLSAVEGIKAATPAMTEERVVWISVAILILLFSVQSFGTDKVGYSFAPIILIWFTLNTGIGLFNYIKYDPTVVKAINPWQIVEYFKRNRKEAWVSLGGTEALFADLGHFTVRSIQISTYAVTYPALILAYFGLASYLRHHPLDVNNAFFKALPGPMYWPVFVVAVLAAFIASQAMISGTFSILQQSLSHGCFPRVKVIHTSAKYEGQVYIPEINFILMLSCVCVTLAFKTTDKIGNAYVICFKFLTGIAVVFAETITSSFMVLVMLLIWKKHVLIVIVYIIVIMSVEVTYLSSVLYKFPHGGFLPIAFAAGSMMIMFTWNCVYRKKYYFEMDNKVSPDELKDIAAQSNLSRIPGLAIFYSELVHGIPPIFEHYAANIPALHSILVFVSFKSLPISKIPNEEKFLFLRVRPRELNVFRCMVRYSYTDVRNDEEPFEKILVEWLKEFMHEGFWMESLKQKNQKNDDYIENEMPGSSMDVISIKEDQTNDAVTQDEGGTKNEEAEMEIEALDKACHAGEGSSIGKKMLINYGYRFLEKNLRRSDKVLKIPHKRLLKVGMTYEL